MQSDAEERCSFCGRAKERVRHLVEGPGVYICDVCIHASLRVIESNPPRKTSRRWYWPLLVAGVLLFSLGAGFLWSIAFLYRVPELPRRVAEYDSGATIHTFGVYVDVSPIAYVIASALIAGGAVLVAAASRLR